MAGNTVAQKTVLLGVTGCIAAYKAAEILRGLQKAGYRVKVVMTQDATEFVGPVTFRALSHEPVAISLFDTAGDPIHHISLAKEADLVLLAPCTANMMAKIAHGIADDLLSTTVLATTAPVLIAPAMNVNMWENPATQGNRDILASRGFEFVGPTSGYLACGDEGTGKLADVDSIVAAAIDILAQEHDLIGRKVFITAGPTHEPIDPVRFIGNRSSGKTGYAIARAAAARGAEVTLVSGPVSLPDPAGVDVIRVETAREMLAASEVPFSRADIAIFSAAVADFAPATFMPNKVKKLDGGLKTIDLVENPDILATLATSKGSTVVVGFAAETDDVIGYAKGKLSSKHADLIVANDVGGDLGFGTDDNVVWLVSERGVEELGRLPKTVIANRILDVALTMSHDDHTVS